MARELELAEGETILERCKASASFGLRSLWQGDLWITNQRIVWRRHGFSPPYPKPSAFEIPLANVHHANAKDLLGAFGGLNIHTGDKRYTLLPYLGLYATGLFFNGRLARRLAGTINENLPR